MADPKLVSRKVGGDGRSPFPAEMWTLLAGCREALLLVFSNPQAHGYLSADFSFFIGVRLIFFHSIFFHSTNKRFSKGFVFVLIFFPLFFSLLVLFPHPADFSANPPLAAAVFPPSCPGCSGLPASRSLGAATAAHTGARSGPGDPTRPRSAIPAGEQHPGRGVLARIYIKARSLCIIPHLERVLEELETLCSPN